MEELLAALAQAFADYRRELEECRKASRPTDGLLGFGRSEKDDPCHDRFYARVGKATEALVALRPSPEAARRAAELLLARDDLASWPRSARYMLQAAERHFLPLIPFLAPEDAAAIREKYTARYKRWERLPVQEQLLKALKARQP